jgi:hypothetical protein
MSKHTNIDTTVAAGLQIVHILQHQTSRPTTNSTQTIVNALKMNFSILPVGKYGQSTTQSTP